MIMKKHPKELSQLELNGKLFIVEASISETIEELKNDERIILVEGKHDEKVLETLGIDKERIIKVSSMPLHKLIEIIDNINCKSVINLLDYDKEGRKKTLSIKKNLKNVKLDERFRKTLFLKTRTSCVEGLPAAIESIGRRIS
jgi:5S rRNA maturation endonuclease (ribonuclease M5)